MKKKFVILLIVFASYSVKVDAQVSFLGFNHPICASPMTDVYTYSNYNLSHGGGFSIYRNGIGVYSSWSPWGAVHCIDLIFINDSTGFLVTTSQSHTGISKTTDYGLNWTLVGHAGPYLGLYIIDANYGYVVHYHSNTTVLVNSFSDVSTPSNIIFDSTLNDDIYIVDSIPNCITCNVDSLNITVANNFDTATYHIGLKCRNIGIDFWGLGANSLEIYPNPGVGKFNITIPDELFNDGNLFLNIYSYGGKLIRKVFLEMPEDRIELNLIGEAKGIYQVKLGNLSKSYSGKIIIQ